MIFVAVALAAALALMFLASGWTVLAACGANTVLGAVAFKWCDPSAARSAVDPEAERAAVLRNRIAQLERRLLDPKRCAPQVTVRPPEPTAPTRPDRPASPPVTEAPQACPPGKVARAPNELVFVVDASGSMDIPQSTPAAVDRDLQNRLQSPNPFLRAQATMEWERFRRAPETDRMEFAKAGLTDAIKRAPAIGRIGLVSFGDCGDGGVVDHGAFGPAERGALLAKIGALKPISGTPLARALSAAASAIQGGASAADPVNMVLVTDGNDSCQGNPCAVAKALKAKKPGLVINVVDLAGWTDVKCVAEATGGFYKSGTGRIDLKPMLREAAGFEGVGMCRPGK